MGGTRLPSQLLPSCLPPPHPVYIRHLSLTNFRNYRRLEVSLPTGALILVGRNAQGKTSILEAIHYLTSASSLHGTDRQLLNWLAVRTDANPFMKIVAEVVTAHEIRKVDVRLETSDGGFGKERPLRKTVLINGVRKQVGELSRVVNAVLFLPQDMALVEGAPALRRRYLDALISQVDPDYAPTLLEYGKVLTQRNALLKQFGESGRSDESQLQFWDVQLCQHGAILINKRARALEELELYASRLHRDLTGGLDYLHLAYQPNFDPVVQASEQLQFGLTVPIQRARLAEAQMMTSMQARLLELRAEELARGVTVIGPHRDELRFIASGVDIGLYGSRGQGRSAVLALKLAELQWIHARTDEYPILLLDEVLAELDSQRRRDLLERTGVVQQSLMTTTDLDGFEPAFRAQARIWQIHQGTVEIPDHKR
ncbi:MAG TPA: DNA replication/repair protein RecF [Anaerolineales bacterium]|nr:DNA replication/repair protein RecF [Anaerolineales bacterium]